jgi:hypothetical protein
MTRGRILSPGLLARASELRVYLTAIRQSWRAPAGREAMSLTQSEFDKMGQMQGSLAYLVIGIADRAGLGNMADRI